MAFLLWCFFLWLFSLLYIWLFCCDVFSCEFFPHLTYDFILVAFFLFRIHFVSDLLQVDGFLRVLRFQPPINCQRHDITEILLKMTLNTITLTPFLPFTTVKGQGSISSLYQMRDTGSCQPIVTYKWSKLLITYFYEKN